MIPLARAGLLHVIMTAVALTDVTVMFWGWLGAKRKYIYIYAIWYYCYESTANRNNALELLIQTS